MARLEWPRDRVQVVPGEVVSWARDRVLVQWWPTPRSRTELRTWLPRDDVRGPMRWVARRRSGGG